jgi:putative MATE family efflux protein
MSFVMNNVLRAEGKAVLSMIGLVVGAVINVALDPILIFGFGMGVHGAAIATFVSQCISFLVLLFMFLAGKTIVRLRLRAVSLQLRAYGDIIATGFPSFCRQILASLCTVFLNRAAAKYGMLAYPHLPENGGADAAQSALGVVQKMFMLAFSISLGIGQGYQPVLGYNYSAKRFDRVRSAYLFTLAFSTGLMLVFALICGIGAPLIMKMFSRSPETIEVGTITLICQCIAMPLLPVNFMSGLTYQVVGNKAIATILSVSRQGLFYIPAVLILPKALGMIGVQSCQALSDFCAFFFAIPFTIMFFNMIKREKNVTSASEENLITE